jgi:hypothetical protein
MEFSAELISGFVAGPTVIDMRTTKKLAKWGRESGMPIGDLAESLLPYLEICSSRFLI